MIRRLFSFGNSFALSAVFLLACQTSAQETTGTASLVKVPGVWEQQAGGRFNELDGFVWYRCYVKVPEQWTAKKRSLWGDSVTITVEHVANAFELFVNGKRIGQSGSMPPNFEAAPDEVNRFKVPFGLLEQGQYNVIAFRVYNHEGNGGFKGKAPVIAGYYRECVLKGDWEFSPGSDLDSKQSALADKPKHAAFDTFNEATSALARPAELTRGKRFTPEESLSKMKTMDGLVVETMLSEPIVGQPLSMSFDERGRLWVVQYRQYPYPAGLKMVSRDKYYRAVYDKIPQPPPHGPRGADRVTIHEDTDGDGTLDKHKTFVDGLNIATSVARGRGGVWMLNPPYLLFYPDADNDDVPDGDPVVHLQGFGLEDTHSVVNNLHWGPDGWLYGAQGSTVSSHVTVIANQERSDSDVAELVKSFEQTQDSSKVSTTSATGGVKSATYCEGPAIWRYHPETGRYELFAEGGGNAFCIEFDSDGRMYSGHNGSDTRGFHYMQGGYYVKGTEGKYGAVSNLYAFGLVPAMKADTRIPRFSHALVKYEASALKQYFGGKFLSVDPLHRNVVLSDVIAHGSTFDTKDSGLPIESDDITFRPIDIQVGPDGAVYVADMCEEFIAHGQHFQGQIDPDSGRVYRLRSERRQDYRPPNLNELTSDQLVDTLAHSDKWFRQTALRLIADRQDKSIVPRLHKIVSEQSGDEARDAFWALNLLGELDDTLAINALNHKNWAVRSWTVRLLGDRRKVSPPIAAGLAELAKNEVNGEVRAQLACTARRLPVDTAIPMLNSLLTHAADADDPFIPMLLWWAVETQTTSNRDAVIALFEDETFWHSRLVAEGITQKMSRRLATSGTRADLLACARLFNLAPDKAASSRLMDGFEKSFKGRSLTGIPRELATSLSKAGGGSLSLRVRQNDAGAIDEALKQLASTDVKLETRIELAQTFGEVDQSRAVPVLLSLLDDHAEAYASLREAALGSLQNYSLPSIATEVLSRYDKLSTTEQNVAQTLLTSRKAWCMSFLNAVNDGLIPKDSVAMDTVRRIMIHSDTEISELVAKHWKSVEGASSEQMQKQLQRSLQALDSGDGNPYRGHELYEKSCAKCHLLFGKGGRIGPDLTSLKRDDTANLLLSIVNPSAEVREGFEQYMVLTDEGRTASGFLFDQDTNVVVLRGQDGQNITIQRDSIEEMIRQGKSLMPEGLLDELTEQQIRDLMSYLRQSQPISK